MVLIRDPKNKHKTDFIIKSNESLAENKIKINFD